ncbi:MAG TPA: alkaline phosphatase PhoX, partial [Thermaerobacter sp.]
NNNVWVADRQGHLYRFASVPNGAEGTGPSFTPDGKNFFFSIQHPDAPWKDSVVVVRGPGF